MNKLITVISTLILLMAATSLSYAQPKFPEIKTTSLQDQQIHFPIQLSDRPVLVALVFSSKAQDDLNSWLEPVYQQVLDENGMGALVYDCHIKLLVAFTGAKRAVASKVEKELKKATNKDYLPHVLIYEGDYKTLKDPLNLASKKEVYFFVVDENGKIAAQESGRFTQRKFDRLSQHLER